MDTGDKRRGTVHSTITMFYSDDSYSMHVSSMATEVVLYILNHDRYL